LAKDSPRRHRRVNRLKTAVGRLIRLVGAENAARAIGKSLSQVYRYASREHTDEISVRDVLALQAIAGDLIVTGFMAHEQGAVLLVLPAQPSHRSIHAAFGKVGETLGALFAGYAMAHHAGGRLDGASAGGLIERMDYAMSAMSDARAQLARFVQ
jgi:hypothetical protein